MRKPLGRQNLAIPLPEPDAALFERLSHLDVEGRGAGSARSPGCGLLCDGVIVAIPIWRGVLVSPLLLATSLLDSVWRIRRIARAGCSLLHPFQCEIVSFVLCPLELESSVLEPWKAPQGVEYRGLACSRRSRRRAGCS